MFCVKYSIYRVAVVFKCYRAVVLWNVTSLHLGKLVIQGYKLVLMAIVVNNSKICVLHSYYSIGRLLTVQFALKEHWCRNPLIMRT